MSFVSVPTATPLEKLRVVSDLLDQIEGMMPDRRPDHPVLCGPCDHCLIDDARGMLTDAIAQFSQGTPTPSRQVVKRGGVHDSSSSSTSSPPSTSSSTGSLSSGGIDD